MTLAALHARFLQHCAVEKRLRPMTIKSYRSDFGLFLRFLRRRRSSTLSPAGLRSFHPRLPGSHGHPPLERQHRASPPRRGEPLRRLAGGAPLSPAQPLILGAAPRAPPHPSGLIVEKTRPRVISSLSRRATSSTCTGQHGCGRTFRALGAATSSVLHRPCTSPLVGVVDDGPHARPPEHRHPQSRDAHYAIVRKVR